MNNSILCILTGGTIDSFFNGTTDSIDTLQQSAIPHYIESMKLHVSIDFHQACMKDSRALTMTDLSEIVKFINNTTHTKIIITHGTYTMPDTAKFLQAHLTRTDVTIIFTGSMIPLTGFSPSDAGFNLGYSIAKLQDMTTPGIFVCMNGKIFDPDEVVKSLYEGRFNSIHTPIV